MELKYVGDKPKVSTRGVGFDHTQPDKYIYLHAAVELLDALSYGATETTKHLYNTDGKDMNAATLLESLKKYITDIEEISTKSSSKAEQMVNTLTERVESNDALSADEKIAWLNNIKMMTDYYLQYVTNQTAYEAALDALAKQVHTAKIKEVSIPMFRNYGLVLSDLTGVLESQKSPIDSDIEINMTDKGLVGTVKFSHKF